MDKSKIPNDQDTRTLKSEVISIGGYDCVFEIWSWDGISGTSFIFDKSEISSLSDNEIRLLVFESLGGNAESAQVTQSRSDHHVFINVFFSDDEEDLDESPELTDEDLQLKREKRDQWVREHNARLGKMA